MTQADGKLPIVVLISGNGSNLQALIDAARQDGRFVIRGVISNRSDAAGLARANDAHIPTRVIEHTQFADRAAFDEALAREIDSFEPGLVVLAGFMRILTSDFVNHYAGRMINIHPSLLPAFQGLHTHRRALEAGVSEHGASVHFVTDELDGGPVVAQVRVAVRADDSESVLAERVLQREHELLPQVVNWFAEGTLQLRDHAVWLHDSHITAPVQC